MSVSIPESAPAPAMNTAAAPAALLSKTELQALVLDAIPSIIAVIDDSGTVVEWNRGAQQLLSVSSDAALGRRLDQLTVGWDRELVLDKFRQTLRDGQPQRLDLVEYHIGGDRHGILGLTFTPFGDGRRALGCILQGADITRRKKLESMLSQAQKMESIGQLAAGIAHEINTPTQYLGDNIQFLQEAFEALLKYRDEVRGSFGQQPPGPSQAELARLDQQLDLDYISSEIPHALNQALQGIEQVSRIVRAMKQFSHPDSQRREFIDVNKAIENTLTVTHNEWKYLAEVERRLDPELPSVPGYPGEFNQTLLNIIVNAAHAIEQSTAHGGSPQGRITVATRRLDGWVEVRISDTGCGIPEAIRPRIFDLFFTTKEVGKGTGQGLAIAYSVIVDKHQGTLTFETADGGGTTFIIRLPEGASDSGAPAR